MLVEVALLIAVVLNTMLVARHLRWHEEQEGRLEPSRPVRRNRRPRAQVVDRQPRSYRYTDEQEAQIEDERRRSQWNV